MTPLARPVPGSLTRIDGLIGPDRCIEIIDTYRPRPDWIIGSNETRMLTLTGDLAEREPFLLGWFAPVAEALVFVNRKHFGFRHLSMPHMQLLEYGPGDAHRPHCDGNIDTAHQWVGIVLALTDPSSYAGGEFHAHGLDPVRHPQGSVTFIPGHIRHHVAEVTAGTRHVLTAFACTRPLPVPSAPTDTPPPMGVAITTPTGRPPHPAATSISDSENLPSRLDVEGSP
jgi:hypothetical protein